MPRKKIPTTSDIKLSDVKTDPTVTKVTKAQKLNRDLSDVAEIKKKMAKVNLYLSLLNKQLFETVAVADVDIASEIEHEVNEFLIAKAKSIFSGAGTSDFNPSELAFLKLLSKKGTEVKTPVQEIVPRSEIKEEAIVSIPVATIPVQKPVNNSKPNVIRKTVSIIGEDGKPKEVQIETEKPVPPPPGVKRLPPPSFEQQMARAHADMAVMQRAVNTTSGPLVVDSSELDNL